MLLLSLCVLLSACNNDKGENNTNNNREKDDYGNRDDNSRDDNNNNRNKWSAKDVRSFNNDCNREMGDKLDEDQLKPFCSCLLDKMQDKFSTYAAFNEDGTENDGVTVAKRCMAELGINTGNNTTGSEWTKRDEDRFMDDCESEARKNVPAARANRYCDCMLQKSKRLFSSYLEADRGLTQLPADELQGMVDDCNREQ